jgi:phosphate uptake regulator
VNLAKIAELTHDLPQNPKLLQRLQQMGAIALRMVAAAMDALARRDLDLARQLPQMDDPNGCEDKKASIGKGRTPPTFSVRW